MTGADVSKTEDNLNAAYLLKLETSHRLSESAIQAVVENTESYVQYQLHHYKNVVKKSCEEKGININDILDDNMPSAVFANFKTKHKREQFYVKECGLVAPKEIVLGTAFKNVKGHFRVKKQFGYVVPFRDTLQTLLHLPEVVHCIENSHESNGPVMKDICDGDYIKSHPLFMRNKEALQIILNTDDLEVTNPLGTHTKKHKVTMFYATLGNIPPDCRSKLSAIYLVAVAKTVHLKKHGTNKLLKDFIDTVNELSTQGIRFLVNGNIRIIEGALVMVVADTPAAAWLGGFKEGVSFAQKPCRTCNISANDLKVRFQESEFHYRTKAEHAQICESLADPNLTKKARAYWSKSWGVNNTSSLTALDDFDLCMCLVQDPMHILLEGVIPYELALFLHYCIYGQQWVTLKWLNDQLAAFPYSYLEVKDKPEPIQKQDIMLDVKVKQTSASMLTLCGILPYILALKVPEDDNNWTLFLTLLQILHLCTSPCASYSTSAELKYLIHKHHFQFKRSYYKSAITPKMHYMCHFPRQIRLFGPGRYHWCMRFEAKHSFFTSIKWKNFKNLPKSMAIKHQKWLCCQMMSPDGNRSQNYLYCGDDVKHGDEILLEQVHEDHQPLLARALTGAPASVFHAQYVDIHGTLYKPGCILLLGYDYAQFPMFGFLESIYMHEHRKFFIVKKVVVNEINQHLNAFSISVSNELELLTLKDLYVTLPLSVHLFKNSHYVSNKFCHISTIF